MAPLAPMPLDTGTSSALGWINLATCDSSGSSLVRSCCPSRFGNPKGQHPTDLIRNWFQSGPRERRPPMRLNHRGGIRFIGNGRLSSSGQSTDQPPQPEPEATDRG